MGESYRNSKLTEYLKKNLKKGYPIETLRVALVGQGYSRALIDEAIKDATESLAKEAPILKEKPQIEHEVVEEKPTVVEAPEKKGFFKTLFGKK